MSLRGRSYKKVGNKGFSKGRNKKSKPSAFGRKKNEDNDRTFVRICSLFLSKSGNSYNAFVKRETIKMLEHVEEGDIIGVSEVADNRLSLWLAKMNDTERDDDYEDDDELDGDDE